MKTVIKVLHQIQKQKWFVVLSILLAAITVVLTLYAPILFGDAIDYLIAKGNVDFSSLTEILSKLFFMIVLTGVLTWIMNVINNHVTFHVVKDIRSSAIERIQVLPLKYLDAHSTGDIVSRIIADAEQLSDGLLLGFTQLFTGIITIFVTLYFMFSKSIWITLLVLVCTPVSFLVARFIATHSYTMFKKQSETRGKETALIEEMVGNAKVVKAFGYENNASDAFRTINTDLCEYSQKATFYSSLTNPCTRAVNNVIYALVALIGAYLILHDQLTVGGLSILLSYANQYMKPFNDISSVVTELQNAMACAERIFSFMETDTEVEETSKTLQECNGSVSIQDVSFRYDEAKPLIEDFNLEVKPGMRIALVGPTGCGKTTFINLLMRFYDVRTGAICIDGENIKDLTRHSVRSCYGMVLQETWLKEGTVRDNLIFGKENASEEEIIHACKEAHSWEFIKKLPKQLDTYITEDTLSAGQKQLLCITRVMLALPAMLILDEATSAIDTRTELQIQNAFDTLMKGRTSFIVAHRLSTIRNADVILVMKDGKIIESGNHESLMEKKGFYEKLYSSQFVIPEKI